MQGRFCLNLAHNLGYESYESLWWESWVPFLKSLWDVCLSPSASQHEATSEPYRPCRSVMGEKYRHYRLPKPTQLSPLGQTAGNSRDCCLHGSRVRDFFGFVFFGHLQA